MKTKQLLPAISAIVFLTLILLGSTEQVCAQAISELRVSHELAKPESNNHTLSGTSKIHLFFMLSGIDQVSSVEVLIGTTSGNGDLSKTVIQVALRNGIYYLVSPTGEFEVTANKAHIGLNTGEGEGVHAKYLSVCVVSNTGIKSPYAIVGL